MTADGGGPSFFGVRFFDSHKSLSSSAVPRSIAFTMMANKRKEPLHVPQNAPDKSHSPLRLLLHTTDGVVPFLTPVCLLKYFPPLDNNDRIVVGVSVRDTCVAPIYKDKQSRPSGYTFSSSVPVDKYLQGYSRVTVPSFDQVASIDSNGDGRRQPKHTTDTSPTATDNHVLMWTPNGRIALSPKMYTDAARGLASQTMIPLYDFTSQNKTTNDDQRLQLALLRTRKWSTLISITSNNEAAIWVPVLVDSHGIMIKPQLDAIMSETVTQMHSRMHGIALIGWQNIQDEALAKRILVSTKERIESMQIDLVVLSTKSLKQFVIAASCGCSVVGTNLASDLAESQKAIVVNISRWRETGNKRQRSEQLRNLGENGCINLRCKHDDVKEHSWFSDTSSIVPGCSCFACTTHSRSYVYHLVCANEMLAKMLLMIHNLHHLLQLLKEIENAIAMDQLERLIECIGCQLEHEAPL